MAEVTYSLVVEITGLKVAEATAGEKGAGEGLKQLEREIRGMNSSSSNTNIKVSSLVKV